MNTAVAYAPNRYHRVQMNTASLNYAPTKGGACSSLKGYSLNCITFRTATDPCMGSGHILVYAFDVLMQIYTDQGCSEREAAESILRCNLYGLDIDRRAYQLAYFAVMMKARQYNRRILRAENQPNLANFADTVGADISLLTGDIRRLAEQFADADTYGSLMEVNLPSGLSEAGELSPTLGISARQLEMMAKAAAILSQKYDAVITNPPYMGGSGMNTKLSAFVKARYADSKADLFACFIQRGINLAKRNGYSCMVTMQSWMFLSSFEKMREKLLSQYTITNLMHMENMVMGIAFGTAVSIFDKAYFKNYKGTYNQIKLQDIVDGKPKEFPVMANRFAQVSSSNFSKIPGSPVAYWVSENFVRAFEKGEKIENTFRAVVKGIFTGDNNKFLRLWTELNKSSINNGWKLYSKGGEYRKWYGNINYAVNWKNDALELKSFSGAGLGASKYFGNDTIVWSKITSYKTSFRKNKSYIYFDDASPALVYNYNGDELYYLGLLNSVVIEFILSILNPTLNMQTKDIKCLPIIYLSEYTLLVNRMVQENITLSKTDWDSFETSWDFERHPLV